jgi:hypothetical protein
MICVHLRTFVKCGSLFVAIVNLVWARDIKFRRNSRGSAMHHCDGFLSKLDD